MPAAGYQSILFKSRCLLFTNVWSFHLLCCKHGSMASTRESYLRVTFFVVLRLFHVTTRPSFGDMTCTSCTSLLVVQCTVISVQLKSCSNTSSCLSAGQPWTVCLTITIRPIWTRHTMMLVSKLMVAQGARIAEHDKILLDIWSSLQSLLSGVTIPSYTVSCHCSRASDPLRSVPSFFTTPREQHGPIA